MCLAWAPASSPPLLLSPPRSPETAPVPTARCTARGRAGCAATPPPRRAWHTRPRRMARAAPPRARPRSSRALALDDAACAAFATVRTHSFARGHSERARRVRPPPPRGRGHRGQRHGKPRACPPPAHAMGRLHVVIPFGLSFVFRTSPMRQHCITQHGTATSRSPSAFSKGAPIRRFEPSPAARPSTSHGRMARARSWRSSASLGTPRACTLIAQRCRADVQRRRLGHTRTTGFRPLGERMAANRHGMRPRGRRAPPMGPHGETRTHILKILGRSPHGPLPRAVVGTSGVGGGLAAWFATRRGCDWPRRPRHRQWRRALRRALERSLAHS